MRLRFERALLPSGLETDVCIDVDAAGRIKAVTVGAGGDAPVRRGLALAGMPNLHSHAFQRAMAGSAEVHSGDGGSFWGWRDVMYRFVEHLDPEDVEAISAFAYMEMLEAGYTSVAEFHYLHHAPGGEHYHPARRLSDAVRGAARRAGMRQLLLPTLYQQGNFDGRPLAAAQRRFYNATDAYLALVDDLRRSDDALSTTGMALHSLRAVPRASLDEIATIEARAAVPRPIHIHIAEQQREVADCLAATGRRPVEWLLETGHVGRHWCLVHATHVTAAEVRAMADSGAVVGLCPTTEGNLGDGRFPIDEYLARGGALGIGSDSHVSIDPREEIRLAEYNVRLWRERRVLSTDASRPQLGSSRWDTLVRGGAQAMGEPIAGLVPGAVADIVCIDTDRPEFAGTPTDALVDAYVFAPRPGLLRDVWVAGREVVSQGRHHAREAIDAAYRHSLGRLRERGVA